MKLRVLLADDHKMVREGLRLILERVPSVEVVGEAENGRQAVELANRLSPDIVVMDVGMPDLNGMDATRQMKAGKKTKVIGLSMFSDKRYVLEMLAAGAAGYVLKDSAAAELVQALKVVAEGKMYLSPQITDVVVSGMINVQSLADTAARAKLGDRERQVLQLLAEGKSSKEIGSRLHISTATVETHRRNVMRKLDLHNVAELTKYAIREGLTNVEK